MRLRWSWLPLAALLASCALESFERGPERPVEVEPPEPVSLCPLAGPPPRPDVPDPEGGETFVVAVRSVVWPDFITEDRKELIPKEKVPGFDLDGRCSCTADVPLSCVTAPGAIRANHCDDAKGRDNNLSVALAPLAVLAPDPSDLFSTSAEAGRWSVIIEVKGYSGAFNDPRVEVATFGAVGFGSVGGPAWDGDDVWDVRADGYAFDGRLTRPEPLSFDPDAYVSEGVMVARLPIVDINLEVDVAEGLIRVSNAVVMANVEERPTGTALTDGVVGGWITKRNALRFLASYRVQAAPGGDPIGLCNDGSPLYNVSRSAACRGADGRIDEGSPDPSCNAISMGVGFTADAAKLGNIVDVPFPEPFCTEEDDPRNDACPGP